ncbi:UNVERIFIED_CONTAM: hypothetical protein Sradi_4948100 [Sesamum radiatum]|uniref:Uncharacterized protein n=1 Tax=Sesamum radiatum TaxID=300843 RepID=A0AAW2MDL4_SESRA
MPSSSAIPPASSTRHIPTPPPPKDYGEDLLVLIPPQLGSEREATSSRATDILKGAATSSDKLLLLSLVSREDLDRMLSLVLAEACFILGLFLTLRFNRACDFLVLFQAVTLRGELLLRPVGESGETQRRRLEGQVERQ